MAQKSVVMDRAEHVRARYRAKFAADSKVYRAPGRVNLIGEHTDYNDGFVLPAAIDYSCWAAIGPGPEQQLIVCSEQFDGCGELDLRRQPQRRGDWTDYPVGVAWLLAQSGVHLTGAHMPAANMPGANIYVSSEVPVGAGLSSSAAIEVATGYALLSLAQRPIERTALALLCQRAENEFVGARCGMHRRQGIGPDCQGRRELVPAKASGVRDGGLRRRFGGGRGARASDGCFARVAVRLAGLICRHGCVGFHLANV